MKKEGASAKTKFFKPQTRKSFITYAMVIVAFVVMQILSSGGYISSMLTGLLVPLCVYSILAVSLNLTVGILGELSLGQAGFMCVGAYTSAIFSIVTSETIENVWIRFPLAILIGGIVAAVFGILIGIPVLRLKGDYLAIVTLAFGEIVRTIVKNLPFFGGAKGFKTTDMKYGSSLFIVAFVVVLVMLFIVQNFIRSKHGRAVTAIRDNEIAAKAMGINVTYYKLFIFVLSAFFAGVAGVIYGSNVSPVVYTTFDYNYSIEILVMVVLGGMGNISGSIISAALLTFVNVKLTALGGDLAALKYLIYSIILIVMVMFNNAPAFIPVRDKIFGFFRAIFKGKKQKTSADINDDEAMWDRVPTKINMDAVLSTDLTPDTSYVPDKKDKGGQN